jgi:hypothetical protein
MTKPRVAVLGLGIMGQGMAGRLLSAGFPLAVYNRKPEKAEHLKSAGAFVARTPREAAARAEVVISMVADDVASRTVWLGPDGALAGAAPGTVLVESSTLSHRMGPRAGRRRMSARMRIPRRAGNWHQAARRVGRTAFSSWRFRIDAGGRAPGAFGHEPRHPSPGAHRQRRDAKADQ